MIIRIDSTTSARNLAHKTSKFKSDIDIRRVDRSRILDGKSIIHILESVGYEKIELTLHSEDENEIMEFENEMREFLWD